MLSLIIALLLGFAPACELEDVTGSVCVWDATTAGNGTGSSFLSIGGGVLYLP